jgi:hypothetical protein
MIMSPENPSHTTASGVTLSLTKDEVVLHDFRRLVFEQYRMREWLDPEQHPDGIVVDKFDDHSETLIVQSGKEVIAGMRIVKDFGLGFPHEDLLKLDTFPKNGHYEKTTLHKLAHTPREGLAEITKLAGKKRQRFLTFDLAKCIYWYAKHSNIELYLMVVDMDFFQLCFKLGIPIDPIGTPLLCEGSWTIPAIIDPTRFEEEIPKKSQAAWDYIALPNNLQGVWASA